jgi:hypothetical protein
MAPDGWPFVAGEVVHHDDVARLELWDQDLLDIELENLAVHRPIDDKGSDNAVLRRPAMKVVWSSNVRAGRSCADAVRETPGRSGRSNFVSHSFHIHVNPFQIVKIIAPDGKTDVSAPGAVDNFGKDQNGTLMIDPQYPGLKGVWKDTLFIKNVANGGGPSGEYTVVVRTRYERYIGDFVLHCHILDHEDQGMMQNIRIAVPDGRGGVTRGHH